MIRLSKKAKAYIFILIVYSKAQMLLGIADLKWPIHATDWLTTARCRFWKFDPPWMKAHIYMLMTLFSLLDWLNLVRFRRRSCAGWAIAFCWVLVQSLSTAQQYTSRERGGGTQSPQLKAISEISLSLICSRKLIVYIGDSLACECEWE